MSPDQQFEAAVRSVLSQFELQSVAENSTVIIPVEGIKFPETLLHRGETYASFSAFTLAVMRFAKVNSNYNDIRFSNCSFEKLVIDEFGSKKFNFEFANCDVKIFDLRTTISLENLSLNRCNIEKFKTKNGDCGTRLNVSHSEIQSVICVETKFKQSVKFENCSLGEGGSGKKLIDFSRAEFSSYLSFADTNFFTAPAFFESKLSPDVELSNVGFHDLTSRFAWRAYRTLKQIMADHESDHEAMMFHGLELEARCNTVLPKSIKNIIASPAGVEAVGSFVLKGLTDYGRNLWLPLLWQAFFAVLLLILYIMGGGVGCISNGELIGWLKQACETDASLIYAAKNFFGPFGIIYNHRYIVPNTLIVEWLGFFHLLLSSVIWFAWLLQLRARFKM